MKNYVGALVKGMLMMSVLSVGTACYRMPAHDEYSTIPVTNNPDLTGDTGATAGLPNLNY